MTSAILTGLCYVIIGAYSYLESNDVNVENLKWIPVVVLSILIFVASFGLMSVPFVVIPEVLPQKV